jgi:hypothetical protein
VIDHGCGRPSSDRFRSITLSTLCSRREYLGACRAETKRRLPSDVRLGGHLLPLSRRRISPGGSTTVRTGLFHGLERLAYKGSLWESMSCQEQTPWSPDAQLEVLYPTLLRRRSSSGGSSSLQARLFDWLDRSRTGGDFSIIQKGLLATGPEQSLSNRLYGKRLIS